MPGPLPPSDPPLRVDPETDALHAEAVSALGRLAVATAMVPDRERFLHGYVRKEALLSSEIEGTEATLAEIVTFEAGDGARDPTEDVEEVCNYVAALRHARARIADPSGLPISARLLCEAHAILMRGIRGADRQPGVIRRSQNWIGGSRPGNARFVPPPPDEVGPALSALESWIHGDDPLPPLVKIGLAHVQFETIHPFLDGNGRIGRLLITLLVEHWKLLSEPLLYTSLALKRRQREYYDRLTAVRTHGDWEGWTRFFLEAVRESAEDATRVAGELFRLTQNDRAALLAHPGATVNAIRLFELLPTHPAVTLPGVRELLDTTAPTGSKVLAILVELGILHEVTGRQRDRVYVYRDYVDTLAGE